MLYTSTLSIATTGANRARLVPAARRDLDPQTYEDLVEGILPLFGGGRLLEIGVGSTGRLAPWHGRGIAAAAVDTADGRASLDTLAEPDDSADAVLAVHALEYLPESDVPSVVAELARVTRRHAFVRVCTAPHQPGVVTARGRDWWEEQFFAAGFGRHPLYQWVTPYAALEREGWDIVLAFEKLPTLAGHAADRAALATERDLHMDMLRESGRRSDAHVARYTLAAQFVRPRDRVLDAACGLGYGAAILYDATAAESVLGLDLSASATSYARAVFASRRRGLSFVCDDLDWLRAQRDGAFDVIVSFETLEHVAEPEAFVAEAARTLTPGGRFICSVPNRWVDDSGRDPNPYHLHVFDFDALRRLFGEAFRIERVFGQDAGGGMKRTAEPRQIRDLDPHAPADDPEWWLVVAMRTPERRAGVPFRLAESARVDAPRWPVVSFERDYDNPWLARAIVSRGIRATSRQALTSLARDVLALAPLASADAGAALCVLAYDALERLDARACAEALPALDAYCAQPAGNPHVERWRVSNSYVAARLLMQRGEMDRAERAYRACAGLDCLAFGPLLATKTVDAAFWAGWLAVQRGDGARARQDWLRGLETARRAAAADWTNVVGDPAHPLLFGLREMTQVFDLASRCGSALYALDTHADRPGSFRTTAFHSLGGSLDARDRKCAAAARQQGDLAAMYDALASAHDGLQVAHARLSTEHAQVASDRTSVSQLLAHAEQRLLHALADPRGVAIFGAGAGGRLFGQRWRAAGGTVCCHVDNRSALWGTEVDGHPVLAPAALPARGAALVVIASSIGASDIASQLDGMGLQPIRDYLFADLFRAVPGVRP